MLEVTPGNCYRHYKGEVYKVLLVAKHTETCEELVVYQRISDGTVWARPYNMFCEKVVHNRTIVKRFEEVAEEGLEGLHEAVFENR